MTSANGSRPTVYGQPGRVEVLLDSIARLMALEPVEVWADARVQRSLHQFSALAARRSAEATALRHPVAS